MPSGSVNTQNLLRLAFGFDDGRRPPPGCPDSMRPILTGKADLLGVRVLALQAEFRPWRVDQLDLRFPEAGRPGEAAAVPAPLPGGPAGPGPGRSAKLRPAELSGAALGAAFRRSLRGAGGRRRRLGLRHPGQREQPARFAANKAKKAARAAPPTWPRYGNSLRENPF